MATPDVTRSDRGAALRMILELPRLLRLYLRLMRDRRVGIGPKLLLVGTIAYVILPFDLIPDTIPFVGQIDDVVLLVAAGHWFLQWCPADVVQEHIETLGLRGRVA
jgi:uncharacterized membrane protein YkvA (DUF1232 family)